MNNFKTFKTELLKVLELHNVLIEENVSFQVFADGGFIYSLCKNGKIFTFDVIHKSSEPMFPDSTIEEIIGLYDIVFLSFTIANSPDGLIEFRLEFKK